MAAGARWVAAARRGVAAGAPVAVVALIAYAALVSPYMVDADNAEFSTLGALGGRAHPPGYPLYVLWLRAWSWLPGTTPAHTAGLATALLGALAVLVLHAACRAWGARPLAASLAVAMFAAAPLVVRYHSQAEVFALNHLIAALVLWLAAARGPLRGTRRAVALGLIGGLGLVAHPTSALLAPVGVLGVVRGIRESRLRLAAAGLALAGFVVGLAPGAYLAIADGPASWGEVASWDDLMTLVLRREYGGAVLAPIGAPAPWTANALAWLATMARTWLWLPAIGGAAMLGVRIARPRALRDGDGDGEPRAGWIALAASVLLAGPVLLARFNLSPEGLLGQYMTERFHLLPALMFAIPVSAALDRITGSLAGGLRRPLLAALLPPIAFAGLVATALPGLARVRTPAVELGVRNLLRSLPADAVVYVVPDDLCGGSLYVQLARHERPDVSVLCAAMLRLSWYRARLTRHAVGIDIVPGGLSRALLASGRAVFVDPQLGQVLAAYPHYPYGIVRRVLRAGAAPPPAREVAALNRKLLDGFDLGYPWPGPGDEYAALAHARYAATWSAIARLLDAAGDRKGAQDAAVLAAQLSPQD